MPTRVDATDPVTGAIVTTFYDDGGTAYASVLKKTYADVVFPFQRSSGALYLSESTQYGTITARYNGLYRLLETTDDVYQTVSTTYAADGSYRLSTLGGRLYTANYTAAGELTSVTESRYFESNISQYVNTYDSYMRLVEQDLIQRVNGGYARTESIYRDAETGVIRQTEGYQPQVGLSVRAYINYYDATGRLAEQHGYTTLGYEQTRIFTAADGSKSITSLSTAFGSRGQITGQSGYDAAGNLAWRNLFDGAGRLVEQDAYDTAGHRIRAITHASDGSYAGYNYLTDGTTLTSASGYKADGVLAWSTTQTATGYSITSYRDHTAVAGTTSADTFTGQAADEHFNFFGSAFGADVITNFGAGSTAGHDVIELHGTALGNYAAVLAHAVDVSGGALITVDAGISILLQGVTVSMLTADNFLF